MFFFVFTWHGSFFNLFFYSTRTESSCLTLHEQLLKPNCFHMCSFFVFLFFFCTLDNVSRLSIYAVPSFFRNCQWNVLFSSPSLYHGCATLDWAQWALEQAQAGGRGKKNLKRTVKSVCAVTSAEPLNELVALPQSRSQETNHSSRFKTEGYCWACWTLRSAPALVRTFTSPLFSCHGKSD